MIERRRGGREMGRVRYRANFGMLALFVAAVAAACVVLVATIPAAGAAAAQEGSGPRIEFDERLFDFRTMYQYQEVGHTFMFRNVGKETLKIEKVKSTCGCTAAVAAGKELAPGEESTLKVTYRSGSSRNRVVKRVYVSSNDPVEPRVTLTIEGEVLTEVNIVPRGVYAGTIKVGQAERRFVEITPESPQQFKILSVESNNSLVRVGDPIPLGEDRPGYKLPIDIGPITEPGRTRAKVKVRTDLEHTKEFEISVYAKTVAEGGEATAKSP
jgi:hypothetical protein